MMDERFELQWSVEHAFLFVDHTLRIAIVRTRN
jgi:hypothetical protein